ncbi:MAG: hypothetical protein ACLUR5_16920 [Eubacterium ventriosum]
MNLADIGIGVNGDRETKTVLFCIIPDSDKSYNFIIGMLYTQIFQELYYQADFKIRRKIADTGNILCLMSLQMLHLPMISVPCLSTMRSRGISSVIIITESCAD